MEEVKIKTFNHFNDEIINEFLKQTKGKIVNYNPVVIEYNGNNRFVDPYLGYNAYLYDCKIIFTPMSNIDRDNYEFINKLEIQEKRIDAVLFNKRNPSMRFMFKGKVVFDSEIGHNYFQVQLQQKYKYNRFETPLSTRDFQGEGNSSVDYNFNMYADSDWGAHFDFQAYLQALNCERINFN